MKVGYAVLMKPFPMVNGKDLVHIFTVIKVKSVGLWGKVVNSKEEEGKRERRVMENGEEGELREEKGEREGEGKRKKVVNKESERRK